MKIIEEIHKEDKKTRISFTIIGDRKPNSLEIPVWEKSIVLSDLEIVQSYNSNHIVELTKTDNAMAVFRQYYKDNFTS